MQVNAQEFKIWLMLTTKHNFFFTSPIFCEKIQLIPYMFALSLSIYSKWQLHSASQALPIQSRYHFTTNLNLIIFQRACLMWVIIILLCFLCPCCWKAVCTSRSREAQSWEKGVEKDVEKTKPDKWAPWRVQEPSQCSRSRLITFSHTIMS